MRKVCLFYSQNNKSVWLSNMAETFFEEFTRCAKVCGLIFLDCAVWVLTSCVGINSDHMVFWMIIATIYKCVTACRHPPNKPCSVTLQLWMLFCRCWLVTTQRYSYLHCSVILLCPFRIGPSHLLLSQVCISCASHCKNQYWSASA